MTTLTKKQEKYIHISTKNKDGRWKSIALTNLALELSPAECCQILSIVHAELTLAYAARIKKLTWLDAPNIIMNPELARSEKLARMINPNLTPLKKGMRL